MTDFEGFYVFSAGQLSPISTAPTNELVLAVADSWLVESGRVRHLEEHFERFAKSVAAIDPQLSQESLTDFFSAVKEIIPPEGRWFPRIEYHSNAPAAERLYLRLRTAPEQLGAITLWTHTEPDPRVDPLTKGPDLSLGMQLRRAAQMRGADEAILLNRDGYISEGALSSIVWWRGEVLCAPSNDIAWLPSITRQEVFAIAEQMGIVTRTERVKPADLVGLEVWALSSLQGIRPVENWIDLGGPLGTPRHLEAFSKRLRLFAASIE